MVLRSVIFSTLKSGKSYPVKDTKCLCYPEVWQKVAEHLQHTWIFWEVLYVDVYVHVAQQAYLKDKACIIGGVHVLMTWVGTCECESTPSHPAETCKVDPFLYQILLKNETHFYTRATNFMQNLLKISHYFPKLLWNFQANFINFCIRVMKLGLFLHKF